MKENAVNPFEPANDNRTPLDELKGAAFQKWFSGLRREAEKARARHPFNQALRNDEDFGVKNLGDDQFAEALKELSKDACKKKPEHCLAILDEWELRKKTRTAG